MDTSIFLPFDEWLAQLTPGKRRTAEYLLNQMRVLGASDPEAWVRSEVAEDIPHLARYVLLRRVWESIDSWVEASDQLVAGFVGEAERTPSAAFADAGVAMRRMLEAGISADDIGRVARMVAYETAFDIVSTIDDGCDSERGDGFPGWMLVELTSAGKLTGRVIGGLHESLLSLDPSGREGRPE
jgi:hypothetical protein